METPTLGDRDAFGVKIGAAGAVVEVFQMRRGRVVDRIELFASDAGTRDRRRRRSCGRRSGRVVRRRRC